MKIRNPYDRRIRLEVLYRDEVMVLRLPAHATLDVGKYQRALEAAEEAA